MKSRHFTYFNIKIPPDALALIIIFIVVGVFSDEICASNSANTNVEKWQHTEGDKSILTSDRRIFNIRKKRSGSFLPNEYINEYYANYYNDYYNNYYGTAPNRKSTNGFYDNLDLVSEPITKYKYTPIFKYRSTKRKRHKLFVPV